MKNFRKNTVLGLKWNMANRMISQVLSLIIGIVLARLLSPKEFGVVGIVLVFRGVAGLFLDFGFTSAIIQNKNSDSRHWSSVFWFNLIISLLLAIIFSLSAPLIADFFNQPALNEVTVAIAWTLVVQAFGMVQISLFQKALRFKKIAIVELISQIIAGVFSIYAAYNGWSYWSLILQLYISGIIRVLLVWWLSDWKPMLIFDYGIISEMMSFSFPLMGTKIAHYSTQNVDNLIVGKMLGTEALGIYTRAYTLMLLPLQAVSRVISSVMFPAYSQIQDQPERIKKIYLSINRVIATITFPMMFGLAVVAESFVPAVLGNQWMDVVPLIQILAPIGAWRSVHTLSGNVLMAIGKTKLLFWITFPISILTVVVMLIGIYLDGLSGLALGYCLASFFNGCFLDYQLKRFINLPILDNYMNILMPALVTLLMCGAVYSVNMLYGNNLSDVLRLIVLVLVGIVSYAGLLGITGEAKSIVQLLKSRKLT
ncbi:MOP flippase family protein [Neolewinella aurantiaca]|uniref:MOP flippase family protein n=1 Tax=Neolewinella aurantiaca TaxID=2602767 RepID=A0A5C7FYZ4_9BACT|nr:MOP flippase family protein [Neolewinella aurantiaca]TXF90947.1 MOP flippase family protein [Neolewinella aurantiaca]